MLTVTKIFEFEAAHYLPDYDGKCKDLHGHSYKLEVEVSNDKRVKKGYPEMLVDFGDIKKIVNDHVIDVMDHKVLNTIFDYPTAEFMVKDIFITLSNYFFVERVRLWETSTSYAEYRR